MVKRQNSVLGKNYMAVSRGHNELKRLEQTMGYNVIPFLIGWEDLFELIKIACFMEYDRLV